MSFRGSSWNTRGQLARRARQSWALFPTPPGDNWAQVAPCPVTHPQETTPLPWEMASTLGSAPLLGCTYTQPVR